MNYLISKSFDIVCCTKFIEIKYIKHYNNTDMSLRSKFSLFSKRLFDIIVSGIGILLLSPVFLVLAILIKKEDGGKVFYRGERIGRFGKPFRIYKFRSMCENADKTGVETTRSDDRRITNIGRIIRKYKFDELSQLINVFIGDMSLVGPRPQILSYLEKYTAEEQKTLILRPGITDWASIRFYAQGDELTKSDMDDPLVAYEKLIHPIKMKYQLKYLKERSFKVDMQILINTLKTLRSKEPVGLPDIENCNINFIPINSSDHKKF